MRGNAWSEDAQAILEREAGRRSAAEIAAMTGHHAKTVERRIRAAGLTAYNWRRERLLLEAAWETQLSA